MPFVLLFYLSVSNDQKNMISTININFFPSLEYYTLDCLWCYKGECKL